jgi:ABC-2 type transport system permease protein
MNTLSYYARLYFLIEGQYIKARLQYRADFIISSVGIALTNIAGIFVFWVLFTTIPNLVGWTFNELLFIYGFYLLAVTPLQIFFDNIWRLRTYVQDGSFIKFYFRPINMMFYYMSEIFDIKGVTQLFVGIAVIVYSSIQLQLPWTLAHLLLLPIMLFSSALVMVAIMIIAACSAFWVVNSFPILALAFKLREFAPYPITLFNQLFRFGFTFIIPLGFVAYYPAQLFLRPGDPSLVAYFAPLVAAVAFLLAYQVWKTGVNHWTGTGS